MTKAMQRLSTGKRGASRGCLSVCFLFLFAVLGNQCYLSGVNSCIKKVQPQLLQMKKASYETLPGGWKIRGLDEVLSPQECYDLEESFAVSMESIAAL